jgi:hypothetical protein
MCWLLSGNFARAAIINVTVMSDAETGANISDTLAVNGMVFGTLSEAGEPNTTLMVTFNNVSWQMQRYIRLTDAGDSGSPGDILAFINAGMNAQIVFGSDDDAGNTPNIPIPMGVTPENLSFDANNSFNTTAEIVPEPANVLLLAGGLFAVIGWRGRRDPKSGKVTTDAKRLTMPCPCGESRSTNVSMRA